MLSSSDIHRMRDTLDGALPGTAVLRTMSGTADGMGGTVEAWTATGTVAARLDYMNAAEATIADRVTERGEYVLTTASTVTIPETARVEYGGETYEVTAVLPRAPWDLCNRAHLVRHG